MMKAWLFIMLLLGGSHAASCLDNATDVVFSEQGAFLSVIIGLMVIIVALAYALGTAIHNPNAVVFAKDEAYHLFFSMLILAGFSSILVFSCTAMQLFFDTTFSNIGAGECYLPGYSPNYVASCYMDTARNDAKGMTERYVQSYIGYLMDSTYSSSIAIPLFNAYTATVGAYKRVISNQYNTILSTFLVPALMSISMQRFVLLFINENIIRWILPVAFVLRFFPPTRHMGNIFIAVSVGLYILVPVLYAFNLSMYEVVMNDCGAFAKAACDAAIEGTNCWDNPAVTCGNPDSLWNVGRLIPQAFFLPNLTIALVITFLASIHKALRVIG